MWDGVSLFEGFPGFFQTFHMLGVGRRGISASGIPASDNDVGHCDRVNHLWSAGMICHGAPAVLVWLKTSSYAPMYSFQYARSRTSAGENFQFFSGVSIRSRNLFFCSLFETFRKNLSITVPFRVRYFSNSLI